MRKMTSKRTKVVSGRLPYETIKEMEELGLKVNECVQIALKTKRTPKKLMEAELRSLLSEQENLASRLADVTTQIYELMSKLNIDKSIDELKEDYFVDDNTKAVQTTLERFEVWRGETSLSMSDFVISREGKRIIDAQVFRCDLTKEDFIDMLFETYDKSIQTKLKS